MLKTIWKIFQGFCVFFVLLAVIVAIFSSDDEGEPKKSGEGAVKIEASQTVAEEKRDTVIVENTAQEKEKAPPPIKNRKVEKKQETVTDLTERRARLTAKRDSLWEHYEKFKREGKMDYLVEQNDKLNAEIGLLFDKIVTLENKERDRVKQKIIDEQFSVWDGSHFLLVEMTKATMNDPKSFDHVETRYAILPLVPNTSVSITVRVKMRFRGKNAFGGVVLGCKSADFTRDGKFIKELPCK